MTAVVAADELMLLERVFLRLGSAESDEQLQNVLCKFLPPVLLKLSSPQEGVRKKVMELLIHVNKRLKSRPLVQLPVEALLTQYQDPEATIFIINFTIIYLKLGFPRLSIEKQAELVPTVLSALENKPQTHLDGLLLMIVPLLGKVKVPTDPEKIPSLFGLNEKPQISKHLLGILLDMLLLPYGALTSQTTDESLNNASATSLPVPPGMSEVSFKRLTANNPMKPEDLEEIKLGVVKFLAYGVFKDADILLHLVVAAADTRFSVANLADNELKKVASSVDWSLMGTSLPLCQLFLGDQAGRSAAPERRKLPVGTRIRLKLLSCLCRTSIGGFPFPACIQVLFDALYGTNTNARLKTLALTYASNIVQFGEEKSLRKVSPVLLSGIQKLITTGEEAQQGQAYVIIGLLAQRFPETVFHDIALLELFYKQLETESPELRLLIREGLLNLIQAYHHDVLSSEMNKDGRLDLIHALIKCRMTSQEPMVRFMAVRTLATVFPPDNVPSRFLLLLLTGDHKEDVSAEARKVLYGTARKGEVDLAKEQTPGAGIVVVPSFHDITTYVHAEAELCMKDAAKRVDVGVHTLPFTVNIFTEIILYTRLCLIRGLNVPQTRNVLKHPCDHTPEIKSYLESTQNEGKSTLSQYTTMIWQLAVANPSQESLSCMIEVVGSLPALHQFSEKDVRWLKDQLGGAKEAVRERAAILYALVLCHNADRDEFEKVVQELTGQTGGKNLELQHGALLCLGYCLEMYVLTKADKKELENCEMLKSAVYCIVDLLKHSNQLIAATACHSLGLMSRHSSLPLRDGSGDGQGSPEAKRPAGGAVTKLDLVLSLLAILVDVKMSSSGREAAARTLGLICVGEEAFPHTRIVMEGLLGTARQTKDVEVHLTIGESLVMCVQGPWHAEARDPWNVPPASHKPPGVRSDEHLEWALERLLSIAKELHPCARQAACMWLLAVVQGCGMKTPITARLREVQGTFMELLCESNDIVQDAASKGLCLLYDMYKSEELLDALVKQLTSGARGAIQVTSDTKLFEEGQLGKSPTGGNLTTYKELCSLASDLNKPDLIYQFMQLANHNTLWNSKKGAAFGFSSIAERCGEALKPHLSVIVPKLYRYQYDPTPNIQASMQNIWRVLVSEPQKTMDMYYDEILQDLLENLNSGQYRVRQSCCLALQDFLKGSANRSVHDCVSRMDELWGKLFRVMDDHHEPTRLAAQKTARVLSKLCIRGCDVGQGKDGSRMVEAILPPLLNVGITNSVTEIRHLSLQTISELVGSAGVQLKPFLPKLIPALLQATGELESLKLSYLSTRLGAYSQAQEAVDSARASFAKSHFTTETVSKSLQYADATILEELVPSIVDLMRSSVGLGTRVACAHFITLLVVQLGADVQPYAGKLLAILVNGLTDRNAAVRKHYAVAIGHLVSKAKETSVEKLFAKLEHMYFEREDDSVRLACAYVIESIGTHNGDLLKARASSVLPLVFFAMHTEALPEQGTNGGSRQVWTDIWTEHSPGTETAIRQNLPEICTILRQALESPSWTMKAQAANAVSTIASKLGSAMDNKRRNELIEILLNGLSGRTWNGKDKLLKALAAICSNCKDGLKEDGSVDTSAIVNAILKESRKEEVTYKISALQSLGDILSALEVDRFDEVYSIIESILQEQANVVREESEESASSSEHGGGRGEERLKLQEQAYETLGKSWPGTEESRTTQERYRTQVVEHCVSRLATCTRSVQVSLVAALRAFVDKLLLFRDSDLNAEDSVSLDRIVDELIKAITFTLGITKHVRLRKESLNVVFSLGQRLKESGNREQLKKLAEAFAASLPEVVNDNQPEIKSRLTDIRKLLEIDH